MVAGFSPNFYCNTYSREKVNQPTFAASSEEMIAGSLTSELCKFLEI